MSEGRYIGLISGTSADGVDAVVTDIDRERRLSVHHTGRFPYPEDLEQALRALVYRPSADDLPNAMQLDRRLGEFFADACLKLLREAGIPPADITAIGSHGQTLRHYPDADFPATLQAGDPAVIALRTGIPVVADLRRADMAAGGQGAPLMPAFHAAAFAADAGLRAIVNIGGIANVSLLHGPELVGGFDSGPGNTLMDQWIHEQRGETYDRDGRWAAFGESRPELLKQLLADDYFHRPPPKSTGQEYFNLGWLRQQDPDIERYAPEDVQATLAALTAESIMLALTRPQGDWRELYVCGGGAHNPELISRLAEARNGVTVHTTAALGIEPDWVEAAGFAWLAYRRIAGLPGNAPAVTGAQRETILGALWLP